MTSRRVLAASNHTFDVRWALESGIARGNDTQRRITVIEM